MSPLTFPTTLPLHEVVNSETGEVVDTAAGRDAAFAIQDHLTLTTDGVYHVRPAEGALR